MYIVKFSIDYVSIIFVSVLEIEKMYLIYVFHENNNN